MEEDWGFVGVGMIIGMCLCLAIVVFTDADIQLSQEAADKACQELSNNVSAVAINDVNYNKLICEIPSYDHTHEIIIKMAGEE